MKWNVERTATAGALALALSIWSAGEARGTDRRTVPVATDMQGVSDVPVTLGEPYKVGDVTYRPEDRADYDDVGYAGGYVEPPQGNVTANGEPFNPNSISAAHRTLPLPSYAEVTSLDTGRTILVRINDRGPFSNDRLIDLSQGAARQLGIDGQARAPVRVRRVNPPQQERAVLRMGRAAAERLESPTMMLTALRRKLGITPTPPMTVVAAGAPQPASLPSPQTPPAIVATPMAPSTVETVPLIPPVASPVPNRPVPNRPVQTLPAATAARRAMAAAPVEGRWFVQLGAFSNKPGAEALAKRAGARVDAVGKLYRVRFGPFASQAAANESLRSIRAKGYPEARILSGG